MPVDCFLDTTVVICAISRAEEDARKQAIARGLVSRKDFAVSGQVLQAFFVIATLKINVRLTAEEGAAFVRWLSRMSCVSLDADLVLRGIEIAQRHQIKYWDGAIVAAAETVNAKVLYSEDLNNTQLCGSVRAVNPFLSS